MQSVCQCCGKTFSHRVDHLNTYCSRQCAGISRRKKPKKCPICGREFISKYHHKTAQYCSNKCRGIAISNSKEIQCDWCGKQMVRCLSHIKKHNFCSRKCTGNWASVFAIKENSYNWKGGVYDKTMLIRRSKKYKGWARRIKERDNYTCWICEERGGKLCSHHLKDFGSYPKLRFIDSNGLTLCEFCHKTYTNFIENRKGKKQQNMGNK